jgi:soluble lytic murein transglycosylase-like protein
VAVIGVVAPTAASAEFLMQERGGVLYVKNVEPPPRWWRSLARVPRRPPLTRIVPSSARSPGRHALAPVLVESVIRVESNFEPRAVSPKARGGLMQLMPATAARLGVRNVFDVRENIEAGVRHLRDLMELYRGDVALTLAAYNAGVDAVAR